MLKQTDVHTTPTVQVVRVETRGLGREYRVLVDGEERGAVSLSVFAREGTISVHGDSESDPEVYQIERTKKNKSKYRILKEGSDIGEARINTWFSKIYITAAEREYSVKQSSFIVSTWRARSSGRKVGNIKFRRRRWNLRISESIPLIDQILMVCMIRCEIELLDT